MSNNKALAYALCLGKVMFLKIMLFCVAPLWCADYTSIFDENQAYQDETFDPSMIVSGCSLGVNVQGLLGDNPPQPHYDGPNYGQPCSDPNSYLHDGPIVCEASGGDVETHEEQPAESSIRVSFCQQESTNSLDACISGGEELLCENAKSYGDSLMWQAQYLSKHMQDLYNYIRVKDVCFADVKKSIYGGKSSLSTFRTDLLRLMERGEDIREIQKGHYRYFGKVFDKTLPPEGVAVSMFNLLCQNLKTLFDLSFQLYRQNYRCYSPEFFTTLEAAMAVIGVHPESRQLRTKGEVSTNIMLRKHWENIKNSTLDEMCSYLGDANNTPEKRDHRRILRCLWFLQDNGDLEKLRALYAIRMADDSSAMVEAAGACMRGNKKFPILQVLQLRKNERIFIDELACMVGLPKHDYNSYALFLGSVLVLAVEGWPIIYNKESYSVIFADPPVPIGEPQKNTNLLTMLYELVQRYQKKLSQEEINYYAYRGGYCTQEVETGMKGKFHKLIDWYTEFLAIQEYIDVSYCARPQRLDVKRRCLVWKVVEKEKVLRDIAYYQPTCPDVTQKDMAAMRHTLDLRKTEDFRVFLSHVEALRVANTPPLSKEDMIKERLMVGPLNQRVFGILCRNLGACGKQEMWTIAKNLTTRTNGGRLIYHPNTAMFVWDSQGRYSILAKEAWVAEIFLLNHHYPDITGRELSYMMMQQGLDVNEAYVSKVSRGLEILGLYGANKGPCEGARHNLNNLLLSQRNLRKNMQAIEVYSWVKSGAMERLWSAYMDVKTGEEEDVCEVASAKRMKLDISGRPENIIRRDIPALEKFLIEKGFCF